MRSREEMAGTEAVCSSSSGESLSNNGRSDRSENTSDEDGQGEVVLVPSRKMASSCIVLGRSISLGFILHTFYLCYSAQLTLLSP